MATTGVYTLSLHDALPISRAPLRGGGAVAGAHGLVRATRCRRRLLGCGGSGLGRGGRGRFGRRAGAATALRLGEDRKSTRLNPSHSQTSYAAFSLKKKPRT